MGHAQRSHILSTMITFPLWGSPSAGRLPRREKWLRREATPKRQPLAVLQKFPSHTAFRDVGAARIFPGCYAATSRRNQPNDR